MGGVELEAFKLEDFETESEADERRLKAGTLIQSPDPDETKEGEGG